MPQRTARRARRRYMLALGLIALLSAMAFITLISVVQVQESYAKLINVSGRQRMLSQRISSLTTLSVVALGEAETQKAYLEYLQQSVDLMRKSHAALTQGSDEMEIANKRSDTVNAMYFDAPLFVDQRVQKYLGMAQDFVDSADTNERLRLWQGITSEAQHSLLNILDKVVGQYELEARQDIIFIERIETVIFISTLVLLVLEMLLIFRPLTVYITEQYYQLINSMHRAQEFIRCTPVSIAVFDNDEKLVMASDVWHKDYRVIKEAATGCKLNDFLSEEKNPWIRDVSKALTGQHTKREKDTLVWADGTEEAIRWEVQPYVDPQGGIQGMVFFSEFVTPTVSAEDLREAATRIFKEQLQVNLDQVFSKISAMEQDENTTAEDISGVCRKSFEQLSRTLERLTSAPETTENITLQAKPLDLVVLIKDVMKKVKPKLQEKGIKSQTQTRHSSLMVKGNEERLANAIEEILRSIANLLPPKATIEARIREANDWAQVELVYPDIPSIPSQTVLTPLLFNRSKKVIEAHEGTFRVQKRVGKGSTVYISLPLVEVG